jgi:hypothetical protein
MRIIINTLEDVDFSLSHKEYKDIQYEFKCECCKKISFLKHRTIIVRKKLLCFSCSCKLGISKKTDEQKLLAKQRYKETCLNKYGTEHPLQSKQIQQKKVDSINKKYGSVNNFYKQTQEKRKQTVLKKYGVDCVFSSKEIKDKIQNSFLDKYGGRPLQNNEVKKKLKQTCLEKYGSEYYFSSKKSKDQINKVSLEKYGVTHYLLSNEVRQKIKKTNLKKYESQSPFGNKDIQQKTKDTRIKRYGSSYTNCRYYYDNIYFDSSYEVAFYVWLIDNDKKFIYHPNIPLEYKGSDNKIHNYYPDFLVEGIFYELKGKQFFNEKGEPFNCYNKEFWWEKYNALKENKVIILNHKDMKYYLKYIKNKYGSKFLKEKKVNKDVQRSE